MALTEYTLPDVHGHAKGEHRAFAREHPIPYTPRMLFLWFHHAASQGFPRSLTVSDHTNYLAPTDPTAVAEFRRALNCARDGDLKTAAQIAGVRVSQAATLAEGLRRGMQCSIGIEADNDPRNPAGLREIIEAIAPERIIRSVHFVSIAHPKTGAPWAWPFDNPAFADVFEHISAERLWQLYIDALVNDLRTLPSDIVGHFYVPSKFGHWPKRESLEEYEDRVLEVCCEKGIAIELNTRILYREKSLARRCDYLTANRRLIRKASRRSVAVVVGSDAHKPADQGKGFDIALELIGSLVNPRFERLNGAGATKEIHSNLRR